jgi:hypothetical protein
MLDESVAAAKHRLAQLANVSSNSEAMFSRSFENFLCGLVR